ncbi:hypothetical protein IMZ48_48850 [Candidatus Bathyarchaeota archaeon]|nr:hypothetical protein [Candidatus Bathyarchaeota archaeon]
MDEDSPEAASFPGGKTQKGIDETEQGRGDSYMVIPPMATTTPIMDLSPIGRPDTNQPRATMVQVFRWPTTVLDTAPVCAMMKNCEMLIRQANRPD